MQFKFKEHTKIRKAGKEMLKNCVLVTSLFSQSGRDH